MRDEVENSPAAPTPSQRLDDLAQIIAAYNQVTEKLQTSHESLQNEVVRLQQELRSTNAQLQRSKRLAALGEMAAGIAHEIRNPLGAIQLYAEMLRSDIRQIAESNPADTDVLASADTATKIITAVRGLDAIVNDVLSFAREITPRPAAVAVSMLFDRAVESHRPGITAGEVRVERLDESREDDATGMPLMAGVDAALIQQVLLNIIRNAVEAMACNHADQPRVLTVDVRQDGSMVVLTIADTGPGIEESTIDRIFNPFFTTRSAGTGLGLAIVHRIVDAHGGSITVHNDAGAVFEISLPAATSPVQVQAMAVSY
jgi:signal transduction histidine kinase